MQKNANSLWKYSFVHTWPLPGGVLEEEWKAEKEKFQKSFFEVSKNNKEKLFVLGPDLEPKATLPGLLSADPETTKLLMQGMHGRPSHKNKKKKKAKRKVAKKQKQNQRKK